MRLLPMENGGLCHLSILNACTDQTNAAPTANQTCYFVRSQKVAK